MGKTDIYFQVNEDVWSIEWIFKRYQLPDDIGFRLSAAHHQCKFYNQNELTECDQSYTKHLSYLNGIIVEWKFMCIDNTIMIVIVP